MNKILGGNLKYFGKTKAGVVVAAVATASSCSIAAATVPLFTCLAQSCGPACIKSNQEFGYYLNMAYLLVGQPGSGKSWICKLFIWMMDSTWERNVDVTLKVNPDLTASQSENVLSNECGGSLSKMYQSIQAKKGNAMSVSDENGAIKKTFELGSDAGPEGASILTCLYDGSEVKREFINKSLQSTIERPFLCLFTAVQNVSAMEMMIPHKSQGLAPRIQNFSHYG